MNMPSNIHLNHLIKQLSESKKRTLKIILKDCRGINEQYTLAKIFRSESDTLQDIFTDCLRIRRLLEDIKENKSLSPKLTEISQSTTYPCVIRKVLLSVTNNSKKLKFISRRINKITSKTISAGKIPNKSNKKITSLR